MATCAHRSGNWRCARSRGHSGEHTPYQAVRDAWRGRARQGVRIVTTWVLAWLAVDLGPWQSAVSWSGHPWERLWRTAAVAVILLAAMRLYRSWATTFEGRV